MARHGKAVPENVRAAADKIITGTKDGSYDVFTGPIRNYTGKERVAKGQRMPDKDLLVMDWYVKGVQSCCATCRRPPWPAPPCRCR